jgi:predicted GH43/DUF377 family glycosyl hydrolase
MGSADGLVSRSNIRLEPDPSRVVAQLFVAGEELSSGGSRAGTVMQRVLALTDDETRDVLEDVVVRFGDRHPDLRAILHDHFKTISYRLESVDTISEARRLVLGAYATNEFAVEAAALCNPSMVAHPEQGGTPTGHLRFILSLRAVGEGHISAIEFRTGTLDPHGSVLIDDPGRLLESGQVQESTYDAASLRASLGDTLSDHEIVGRVVSQLPPTFTGAQLDEVIGGMHHRQGPARREAQGVLDRLRAISWSNYTRSFPPASTLGQRVIRPYGPAESNGMEDARFVRFTDDDDRVRYFATYTAFDGSHIVPRLIETSDFETFVLSEMTGLAATNKGMALFPRRIDGQFMALSRWDRESIAVAASVDGRHWDDPHWVHTPERPWELIQVGNCGSPIETDDGWLVLTHGVGPMRTYSIGVVLLDIDDPTQIIGALDHPLLSPNEAEREGYVPNVVYSCGALVHGDTLVLPYAYGDRVTTFATANLPALLTALRE